MKQYLNIILCAAAIVALAAGCGHKAKKAAAEAAAAAQREAAAAEQAKQDSIKVEKKLSELNEEPVFAIETNLGTIKVRLYAKTPLHRANFSKLALSGFYDGTLFHRVIRGFMIQGGDPLSKDPENAARFGTGGPGYTVPAEFYIVQDPNTCAQLDGQYTVFGETIEGLNVIDKIAAVQTDPRDRPLQPVKIISIKAE